MVPWFVWKGKNSSAMGLWISKLPNITIPVERVKNVTIPGKAGDLNLREGKDVYEPYKKEIVVTCINDVVTTNLLDWLHGDGELIVCNESQFVYHARIAGEVNFTRIGNDLMQATIPFVVHPFKKSTDESQYRETISETSYITNPGNVSSKPMLTLTGTGALVIGCEGTYMEFTHRPSTLYVDCDAEIMTAKAQAYVANAYYYKGDYATFAGSQMWAAGLYRFTSEGIGSEITWEYVSVAPEDDFYYLWQGRWSGEFLRIPVGKNLISVTGTAGITIDPCWRWL